MAEVNAVSPVSTEMVSCRITSWQRVEQGECDVDGGHGVSDVHEHLVLLPIGGDAACQHHHDDGQDVVRDRAPQHRVVDVRVLAILITAEARRPANTMAAIRPTIRPMRRQCELIGLSRPSPTVSITLRLITSNAGAKCPHHCHELFKNSRPFLFTFKLPFSEGSCPRSGLRGVLDRPKNYLPKAA